MRWLLLLVVLSGCPGLKRHNVRNANGHNDIDAPPVVAEHGDPAYHEAPADPGLHRLGIAPGFFVGPGKGRINTENSMDSAVEVGAQLHLSFGESKTSGGKSTFGYPWNAWGVSLGWGFQSHTSLPTIVSPVYLEATRHFYIASASAGIAVYPTAGKVAGGRAEGVDVGAQVTFGFWPYMLRMRYMQDTGFELFGVVQLELPASITWSR
jgi:hypothetical protein